MRINLLRSALLTHFFDFSTENAKQSGSEFTAKCCYSYEERVFIECRIKLYAVIYDFIGHMTGREREKHKIPIRFS